MAMKFEDDTQDGLRGAWNRVARMLDGIVGDSLLLLVARAAVAATFLLSARTKVNGFLEVSDGALYLFREEYKLPLLPPDLAAHLATYAEHLFPLMLIVGLGTRVAALALLGMTAVIQIFVYPDAWPTHLMWLALLLLLIGRGGGALSLDRALGLR